MQLEPGLGRRVCLGVTFLVRYWESKIPAALKLLVVFVWEYFMHQYLEVLVFRFCFLSVVCVRQVLQNTFVEEMNYLLYKT